MVHNGIIENFKALRDELTAKGYQFTSETDTEACSRFLFFFRLRVVFTC